MGTFINFINQHISPSRERDEYFPQFPQKQNQKQQQLSDKPRAYYIPSQSTASEEQRENALQQFPCEEKHSYNPHYQHNLSTSPPSLSSSPSNSFPSSASSISSFSRATGAKMFSQDSHMHQYNYNYSYNTSNCSLTSSGNKHGYSYNQQNLRCYTQQQQQETFADDWMFGIAEDDGYCGASTMARASPQEASISPSSSSSTASLKSSLSRKCKAQHANVMNAFGSNSRSSVTFSPEVIEHPVQQVSTSAISALGLLPSISESSSSSLAADSVATVTFGTSATSSASSPKQQQQETGRMTAKQSLMRIAHCSMSDDGWCSQKAGQYTQRYADTNSRSMRVDGRRSHRL
ncbi:hypothetical protein BGX27_006597 [Mortierella sp. AM989]|nr:hypothetical protein BGX27_006597 [Mortierella sp. AM989]